MGPKAVLGNLEKCLVPIWNQTNSAGRIRVTIPTELSRLRFNYCGEYCKLQGFLLGNLVSGGCVSVWRLQLACIIKDAFFRY